MQVNKCITHKKTHKQSKPQSDPQYHASTQSKSLKKTKTPQTVPPRSSSCSAVSFPSGSANLPAPLSPILFAASTLTIKANRNPKPKSHAINTIKSLKKNKKNASNRTEKIQLLQCCQLAERLRQPPCSFSAYFVPCKHTHKQSKPHSNPQSHASTQSKSLKKPKTPQTVQLR